jgi:type I restriction enzyme S subunit
MSVPRLVPLREVLELDRDEVAVDPGRSYRIAGIYSFGKGIFERDPIDGSGTAYTSLYRLHEDYFVVSRLNGWEGAVDVVADGVAGCFVSNEYPTFSIDRSKLDPAYLRWIARWPQFWSLLIPRGSMVRRKRVQVEQMLDIGIHLPPLHEQQRVSARLDSIERHKAALVQRSRDAREHITALSVSACSRPDLLAAQKQSQGWCRVALGSVMKQSSDVIRVSSDKTYRNFGIRSFGRGLFEKPDIAGHTTSATRLNRARAGQFIYSRLFAFEGAYAFVPPEFDGFFVSNEFPTFDPDPHHLDARWLATVLRSPYRWAELASSGKGLGVRRQRVPVESVLAYEMWLPPIEQQKKMVQAVAHLHAAGTARDRADLLIKALLPAALNEAFADLA